MCAEKRSDLTILCRISDDYISARTKRNKIMSVNVIIFTLLSISICVVHSLNSDTLLNNPRSSEIKSNKLKLHESSKSRFNRLVEDESDKYKSRTATRRKPAHGYYYDSERLADGETEMRMFFGGVRARQTWVGAREGSPG